MPAPIRGCQGIGSYPHWEDSDSDYGYREFPTHSAIFARPSAGRNNKLKQPLKLPLNFTASKRAYQNLF